MKLMVAADARKPMFVLARSAGWLILALALAGCGKRDSVIADPKPAEPDLRILFIGNSHTSGHGMSEMVAALLQEGDGKHAEVDIRANQPFLVDHAQSQDTLDAIDRGDWDYVVLQAQKYSTSGRYTYPTDAAVALTKRAQDLGATVIMYPEFRRRGQLDESRRVHDLHRSIAAKTKAQIAPVGLAWDRALRESSDLVLHQQDGNHANATGMYLTACVFYSLISGKDPSGLAAPDRVGAPKSVIRQLQQAAWKTVQEEGGKEE